jgi:MFS family permease
VIRDRSIIALILAEFVSKLGSQLTNLALPWFVLVTTGSPTRMSLVFAVELAPFAVLGIPAGAVLQRLGPRATLLISDGVRAPLIALVPFLQETGHLTFALLLVIAAVHGVFSIGYFTAQRTILPAVVGEDEELVARANSLVEGTTNVTNFLGPALAGFAIALLGAANVLWVDAASYAVSFLVLAALVPVRAEVADEGAGHGGGIWAGLGYLRQDRLIARASLSSLIFGFLFSILIASFPVLAYQQYDHNPRVAGALAAAFGAGSIVGSLATYALLGRFPGMKMAGLSTLATAGPLWLLVPDAPLALPLAALALCGASIPMINAPYLGMLATRVPRALRAKVLQALITINQLAGPIGFVIAGPLFVHAGLHWTYALVAALATVATANFLTAVWSSGDEQGVEEAA